MKRFVLGLGLVALAAINVACSGASAAPATDGPAAPSAPAGAGVVIVAKDLKFQTAAVTVPADKPVDIVLDNQEGAPHNIAIKDASGATLFKGEIVSNTKVTNAVPALAKGAYAFWCEVHPEMTGTLTAE